MEDLSHLSKKKQQDLALLKLFTTKRKRVCGECESLKDQEYEIKKKVPNCLSKKSPNGEHKEVMLAENQEWMEVECAYCKKTRKIHMGGRRRRRKKRTKRRTRGKLRTKSRSKSRKKRRKKRRKSRRRKRTRKRRRRR